MLDVGGHVAGRVGPRERPTMSVDGRRPRGVIALICSTTVSLGLYFTVFPSLLTVPRFAFALLSDCVGPRSRWACRDTRPDGCQGDGVDPGCH